MSGIGAVTPTDKRTPEKRQPTPRDDGKAAPKRPTRKQQSDDDLVEVEQHTLDIEA
jgi:hypothetical protein